MADSISRPTLAKASWLPVWLRSTGTELTLVAPHWAQRPWFSELQLSLAPPACRPVKTSCACLGLVIFTRISVGSGFMPGASPAIYQSRWLLLRSSGAVFAGTPSILARSISGTMVFHPCLLRSGDSGSVTLPGSC